MVVASMTVAATATGHMGGVGQFGVAGRAAVMAEAEMTMVEAVPIAPGLSVVGEGMTTAVSRGPWEVADVRMAEAVVGALSMLLLVAIVTVVAVAMAGAASCAILPVTAVGQIGLLGGWTTLWTATLLRTAVRRSAHRWRACL